MVYFYRIEDLPQAIEIGYTGEHNINEIQIDYSTWAEGMEHCYPSIVCVRPGGTMEDAYVAATTYEHNVISWSIASSDLGDTEGTGLAQVWLEDTENASVNKSGRSAVFATVVRQSVDGGRVTPPQQAPWLEQMTLLKTQTIIAHDETINAKSEVDYAMSLLDGAVDTALGAASDASGYATAAQGSAGSASASAEAASGSASAAADSATAASGSASAASGYAGDAADSATAAAGSASDAYGYKQTAAGYVNTVQTEAAAAQGWATGGSGGTPSATNNSKAYSLDSEAYAVGTRGGEPVSDDDDAYHNNSKYYAEQAESIIESAIQEAADAAAAEATEEAEEYAEDAEAYAVGKRGGVDVGSSDPAYHNNSKYFSTQAASSATDANTAKTAAQAAQAAAEAAAETDLVAWLAENITNPSSPPLDRTLASSSSAAPADMVGSLKSAISDIYAEKIIKNVNQNNNWFSFEFVAGATYYYKNTSETSGVGQVPQTLMQPSGYDYVERIGSSTINPGTVVKFIPQYDAHAIYVYSQGAGSFEIYSDISLTKLYGKINENTGDISSILLAIGSELVPFLPNKYIDTSGSTADPTAILDSSTGYSCAVLNCSGGDSFTVKGTGGSIARLWCFVDSSNNVLKKANGNETLDLETIIAPSNASKLILNGNAAGIKAYKGTVCKNDADMLINGLSINNTVSWESGRYSATHGGAENETKRIRTTGYIDDSIGVVFGINGFSIELCAWFNGNYIGVWKGNKFEKNTLGTLFHNRLDLTSIKAKYPQCKFKMVARKDDGNGTLDPIQGSNINCGNIYNTEKQIDYDKIVRSVNRIADSLPAPRQSIAGYKCAYDIGFRNMLCDLRFTSDNIPICTHDSYMNEVYNDVYLNGTLVGTDPPVYFSEKTYEQLQDYDFGVYKGQEYAGTKILSLEQMLKFCKFMGCNVYLEMKVYPMTTAQYDAVFALIRKYGMERRTVWAPQNINSVNELYDYNENVYIQFHTNTSGTYTELPDSYIGCIVSATNDYNRGRNTILIPLSVSVTSAQLKTLSDAGIGLCSSFVDTNNEETMINRWISERPGFVESPAQLIVVGKYVLENIDTIMSN